MTTSPRPLDAQDLLLLRALQDDARLTVAQLGEHSRLSSSSSWRRVKRLEEDGIVTAYRAELNRHALGWGVLAFIAVSIEDHSDDAATDFEDAVGELPEIVACWSVSGDADFLMQVVSHDLDSYADFAMRTIRRLPGIKAMRTIFTLKEIKPPSSWPLPHGG